jgi:hypothetical protein
MRMLRPCRRIMQTSMIKAAEPLDLMWPHWASPVWTAHECHALLRRLHTCKYQLRKEACRKSARLWPLRLRKTNPTHHHGHDFGRHVVQERAAVHRSLQMCEMCETAQRKQPGSSIRELFQDGWLVHAPNHWSRRAVCAQSHSCGSQWLPLQGLGLVQRTATTFACPSVRKLRMQQVWPKPLPGDNLEKFDS